MSDEENLKYVPKSRDGTSGGGGGGGGPGDDGAGPGGNIPPPIDPPEDTSREQPDPIPLVATMETDE